MEINMIALGLGQQVTRLLQIAPQVGMVTLELAKVGNDEILGREAHILQTLAHA